ncbi:MAG: GYD domain-containing protein, partial [Candidatus Rokubacteria bacterium]|nr:GYD domain-containing protein [Candidatus Rokubacteria bacterium]
MPTYIVLTRLTPEAVKTPGELKRLERAVADHVRKECPEVQWLANYAILGPWDYLDIFEA